MAGVINLADKYSSQVLERFFQDSYTQGSFSKKFDGEFIGVKSVRFHEVGTVPLVDYNRRGNGNRYGTPKDLTDVEYELPMEKDRSFSFVIDKGDMKEQMGIKKAGECLRREMREVVTPEVDNYRMDRWAEKAGLHVALSAEPSKTTIVENMLDANVALDEHNVPAEGRTFYINPKYYKFIKLASEWNNIEPLAAKALGKGIVGEFDGVPVKKIARMPANVYFMLVFKNAAISPVKLHEYKMHTDPQGYSGALVEGRFLYDAFVMPTMANGIYVACAPGKVCTKPTIEISSHTVTLTAGSGETIKYTLDGSDPRFSKTAIQYNSSQKPTSAAGDTIRAAAFKSGMFWSDMAEAVDA